MFHCSCVFVGVKEYDLCETEYVDPNWMFVEISGNPRTCLKSFKGDVT